MSDKKKKNDGFNTPFANLKSLVKDEKKQPAAPAKPTFSKSKPQKVDVSEDERMFLEAMGGVQPIPSRKELPFQTPNLQARVVNEEAEALAQLYDLVSERGDFELTESPDFLAGTAPGVDRRLINALKRGDFGFQARLELQGKSGADARAAVDAFLSQAKRDRQRCVLLVHEGLSAFQRELPEWLNRGRMGKLALAFCSARASDGGVSALYVLLRR